MTQKPSSTRLAIVVAVILPLSACGGGIDRVAGLFGRDSQPEAVQPTIIRPDPDVRGVITYASYQVIVAQDSDTIPQMAGRVGLDANELAAHNGLPVTYRPRRGEVLALPRNVGGSPADNVWSPEAIASTIQATSLPPAGVGTAQANTTPVAPADNPFSNGQSVPVIDPIRHRVEPGETAFTIARLYGVSVTSLASWNGLDRDMNVRVNQELLIPVINGANSTIGSIPREDATNAPGTDTAVPPPPSAANPLPENQDVASVERPASPNLAQDRTPPGARSRLQTPVAGASVLRGYSPGGARPNEGIDFGAPAGTAVVAAEQGEVALISQSLGGLGTIVLIRHADNLMTVYGRVTDVNLKKGDRVSRGQKIGVVAPGDEPNLHFEVRRGTESVDPAPYL